MNPINRQKAIQPELNHSHEESMHVARAFLREIMNQHKKDPFYLKKIKTQSDKIILISDKNRKITIPKKKILRIINIFFYLIIKKILTKL